MQCLSLLLLPPLKLPIYTCLSPSNLWHLFKINHYCMHMCIYIYIPTYNLFRPHNDACMCVLWTDALALEKQLVCPFTWKMTSHLTNFFQLSIVLRVRLSPCGIYPIIFGISIGIIILVPLKCVSLKFRNV